MRPDLAVTVVRILIHRLILRLNLLPCVTLPDSAALLVVYRRIGVKHLLGMVVRHHLWMRHLVPRRLRRDLLLRSQDLHLLVEVLSDELEHLLVCLVGLLVADAADDLKLI